MSLLKPDEAPCRINVNPCRSDFKVSDLRMLNSPAVAYQLPLAVIALMDMNAFFAQCEQIRLNCSIDDPVVCCQWASLIAVSYAARRYGISRMDTLKSAQTKCPSLIVGHAAVFKKGETHWLYLDGPPDQSIHKVSLDPYRRELRKIFKILSRECDLVEKASVDESYLDLGRLVYNRLVDLFPFLLELNDDESLPSVPASLPDGLRWQGKVFPSEEEIFNKNHDMLLSHNYIQQQTTVQGEATDNEYDLYVQIQDWDDICMLIGSQALYKIRSEVYKELKYTTSGGVASTKTVAKLAAGFVKPDFQTIIRPRATFSFLNKFELLDITQMGGQLGERVMFKLGASHGGNSIKLIRDNWSLLQIQSEFPNEEDLAEKIYKLCRGQFQQEIKLRTVVKSMMSRKNFQERNPVKTVKDCYDWIRCFVGDLYGRLVELDDENLNLLLLQKLYGDREKIYRPRTVSIQLITTAWSRMSKQTQFPIIKDLEKFKSSLELTAFRLLCELLENSKSSDSSIKYRKLKPDDEELDQIAIPVLANMGVVVTNFVTTSDANLIDSYGTTDGGKSTTQENVRRLFDEHEKDMPSVKAQVEEPKPKAKPQRRHSYVKQLFEEFENEKAVTEANKPPPRAKSDFKEDKDYVAKMFLDYEASVMVERASSSSPKKSTKEQTSSSIGNADVTKESRSSSPEQGSASKEDAFLRDMMKSQRCNRCDVPVVDVFEHRDYHIALELSNKLNGESGHSAHHKRPAGQSRLPFAQTKKKRK